MKLLLTTVVLCCGIQSSTAGGRLESPAPRGDLVELVQELILRSPDLRAALSGLEFEPLGHSAYLWPDDLSPLCGVRVGPFSLLARPRGTTGPANLQVIISTRTRYLDATGKVTAHPRDAAAIEQVVDSCEITPLEPPDSSLVGSWRLESARGPFSDELVSAIWTFGPSRSFKAVHHEPGDSTAVFAGYFLSDRGHLTLATVDSATFQYYEYEAGIKHLKVAARDAGGKLALEYTFLRQ